MLVDLALWLSIPIAFLADYSRLTSIEAVVPHLRLMVVLFLPVSGVRLAISLIPGSDRLRRHLTVALVSAIVSLLLSYYLLVLIGLRSWGRVISWPLITTYFEQAPDLLAALGIPLWLAICALLIIPTGTAMLIGRYLRANDWVDAFVRRFSPSFTLVVIAGIASIFSVELAEFWSLRMSARFEPFGLTLFPDSHMTSFAVNSVDHVSADLIARNDALGRESYRPVPSSNAPNLVLIVVDALRPDHLGVYGYERGTTPHLDRLQKAGGLRVIRGVRATCGDSACGLFSLAASRFVHEYSPHPFTLAEALKRNGYRTHMILSGDHTNFYGLKEIYGAVDSFYDGADASAAGIYKNDDQLVLDRLERFAPWNGVPTFFQFHLMSAHVTRKHRDEPERFSPASNYILPGSSLALGFRKPNLEATNFYDNGVFDADNMIGRVLAVLERKSYLERALVVVTADHGEALGEFGLFGHANSVHEVALRIPLLLMARGYVPKQPIAEQVAASQVDIAPTLLTELALPIPENWAGRPLQSAPIRRYSLFREHNEAGMVDASDPAHLWKYWIDARNRTEKVYDLLTDPDEQRDLFDETPSRQIDDWRRRVLPTQPLPLEGVD